MNRRTAPATSLAFEIQEARGPRRFYLMALKAWLLGRRYGWQEVWSRTRRYIQRKGLAGALWGKQGGDYAAFIAATTLTDAEKQRIQAWIAEHEDRLPVIGVVVPIHEPPLDFLHAAVASVLSQLYPRWRLVLALDGPQKDAVERTCEQMARSDSRIVVTRRSRQEGISATTNDGLAALKTPWVTFLDQDDVLDPRALYWVAMKILEADPDVVYTDEDQIDERGRRLNPFFKPDWSPFLLWSMNYWGHLVAVRKQVLEEIGGFRPELDGSQDYDCWLRITDRRRVIAHVPHVAYHWRIHAQSTAGDLGGVSAKPEAYLAAERAVREALTRRGTSADVEQFWPGRFQVLFHVTGKPLVSVIIPFRDRPDLLRNCLNSIEAAGIGQHVALELLLVDNGSTLAETAALLELWERRRGARVVRWAEPFNFSRINNRAAHLAAGEFLLFLNNDTEVRTARWLDRMVGIAQQPNVGAVGAKLLFPNGRVQHAGVIVGLGGLAGHAFYGHRNEGGYMDFLRLTRNVSAVTGACLLTPHNLFEEAGGFDERLGVAFGDVDYCLRLCTRGLQVVWAADVVIVHHESASRGALLQPPQDIKLFTEKWSRLLTSGDPFFSHNLSLENPHFVVGLTADTKLPKSTKLPKRGE